MQKAIGTYSLKAYPCTNHLLSTRKIPFQIFSNKILKLSRRHCFKNNSMLYMALHKSGDRST